MSAHRGTGILLLAGLLSAGASCGSSTADNGPPPNHSRAQQPIRVCVNGSPVSERSTLAAGADFYLWVGSSRCLTSSAKIHQAPSVTKQGPSSWLVAGSLVLDTPLSADLLADCNGGSARHPLGPLAAGTYQILGPAPLTFQVPFDMSTMNGCADAP